MFIYKKFGKRVFDLAVGLILLVFLSPLLLILYFCIRIKLGKSCIFKQERPGYLGKPFTLYKFRTMKDIYDSSGKLLSDAARLTPFGNFLRKTSLDELPELINVIKGDMSLVGPRPLLMAYLSRYSPEQIRRHNLKPGITGLAQARGRNKLTWEEKFTLDLWYIEHVSFWLDLKILFLTFYTVCKQKNTHAENHVTMPEFMGNNNLDKQ